MSSLRVERHELRRSRSRSSCDTSPSSNKEMKGNESVIRGTAHLCFHPDGHWFQGTLSSSHQGMFSMQGRRVSLRSKRATTSAPSKLASKVSALTMEDEGFCSPACFSDEESMESMTLSDMRGSDDSLVDMSDDAMAMEESEDEYTATMTDFDTGVTYRLSELVVDLVDRDSCRMYTRTSDTFEFVSDTTFRGAQADKLLMAEFSPRHTEKRLIVFGGQITFRYTEPVCNAIASIEHSKWCL